MRAPFAVDVLVELGERVDARALGGAVTVALCGALDHPGPCPLAPHRTTTEQDGRSTRARVVGVVEAARRDEAIDRIRQALSEGRFVDPADVEQRWTLVAYEVVPLRDEEQALAVRLGSSPA